MMFLYAVTLFASALLLFLVQPMVGKMILPKLGGTPAVWNTCMVFFQAMLLGGYGYAHLVTARLSLKRQVPLHLLVLALPVLILPISVAVHSSPPSTDLPLSWLLLQLLFGVGLPFVVVSSSAPLLQHWFTRTGHADARDPYFLYAASNSGSLLALLGYPLLVEPHLALADQSRLWAGAYGIMAVLVAACGVLLWRSGPGVDEAQSTGKVSAAGSQRAPAPSWKQRSWWILLAAIPSSLMLGVTTYITTDVAAVPLMWVLPLALYLLTFVLVFARKSYIRHSAMVKLFPFIVLPMGILFFFRPAHFEWLMVPAHLGTFFVAAMICHGELVRRRPAASHLTEFYLLMSAGGVIGGFFNAIVAPQAFTGVIEYPLATMLVCLVLPRPGSAAEPWRDRVGDLAMPAMLAVMVTLGLLGLRAVALVQAPAVPPFLFLVLILTCFTFKARPIRFGLCYAVLLVSVATLADMRTGNVLHAERNFFGVKKVLVDSSGRLHVLAHGTTSHGCQSLDPLRSGEPSSYYHRNGPVGDVFHALRHAPEGLRVGVIGLGVGAIAAYAEEGQHFTFYEIDPAVERIARDERYFTYLAASRGKVDVVLGDGRLTIAEIPDGHFDLVFLDAFSSDSIPTHLLSREAIELYVSKLSEGGLVAFHVSNRFFDFESLLARAADELGLSCLAKYNPEVSAAEQAEGRLAAHCVVMARRSQDLAAFSSRADWRVPVAGSRPSWTDQYCDVLGLFMAGKRLELGPRSAVATPAPP